MHRSTHLSFLQVAHNLGDPFGKTIIPMNESLHEVASFMAFYFFFFLQHGVPRKKQKPRTPAGFPVVHRCYSAIPFSLRSSTHEELCASPAAVLVAPRWHTGWYMRQGAPMGVSRASSMGPSSPLHQHPWVCDQRENPEQRQPSAAQPCRCQPSRLPLHGSTLLSLLQSWIFLFFHLFFFNFIFSPGSSLARHRFPSTA